MLINIRGFQADAVNILSQAFDYHADLTAREVAEDMMRQAQANAERAANTVPESGSGPEPMVRLWAEARLAEMNATILAGVMAQADAALNTYPQRVVDYAVERFSL